MKDWKEWFDNNGSSELFTDNYGFSVSVNELVEAMESRMISRLIEEGYIKKPRKKAVKAKISDSDLESFDLFYSYYPRKTGRQEALKKWMILDPSPELRKKMYDHYTVAYKDTEKSFIPHFSTYLNQARWNDEIIKNDKNIGLNSKWVSGVSTADQIAASIADRNR